MLIRYIRDNRTPVGVVVAIDGKIGWAQCNPRDIWNKHLGLRIAIERAKLSDKRDTIKSREPSVHPITVVFNRNGEEKIVQTTFAQELARNIEIIQNKLNKETNKNKNVDK